MKIISTTSPQPLCTLGGIRYEFQLVDFEDGSLRHRLFRRDLSLDTIQLVAEIDRNHVWELLWSLGLWAGVFQGLTGYPEKEHAYAFPKPEERIFRPWTPAEIHAVGVLKEQGWSVQEIAARVGRNKDAVRHKLKELGI